MFKLLFLLFHFYFNLAEIKTGNSLHILFYRKRQRQQQLQNDYRLANIVVERDIISYKSKCAFNFVFSALIKVQKCIYFLKKHKFPYDDCAAGGRR